MAEEALRITITADNKQALAGLQQTVKSLDQVDKAAGATGGKVVKMGKDFTGLSRVIQDLPYGFNAIANNLTNILPAAGALGLGISALVAGLQFAQLGFANWTRGLVDAKKGADEFAQSLAKEKTALNSLFAVATNNNVAMNERLKAVAELRKNYGPYLKNYSDEAILTGKAADAHLKLVDVLKMEAKAAAVRVMAQPLEQKIIENEIKLQELRTQAILDYNKALKGGTETISAGPGMPSVRISPQQRAQGVLSQAGRDAKALTDEIAASQKALNSLYGTITGVGGVGGGAGGGKSAASSVKDLNKAFEEQIAIFHRLRDARIKAQGQGALGTIMPERDKAKDLTNLKLTTDGNAALNQVLLRQSELQDQRNQNLAIANGLTDMAMNSISGLVNAMANGQNIGQALGDMFKRLAIDIALAAAKAAIFQAILGAVTGGGSAAGGSAFMKGFGKMLGFSEGGTVSGPKSGYPVMLHGTEHIVRPDQMRSIIASASQMGGGNSRVIVEGRISGQDIWLSQQRTSVYRGLTT